LVNAIFNQISGSNAAHTQNSPTANGCPRRHSGHGANPYVITNFDWLGDQIKRLDFPVVISGAQVDAL
jgi:hypothetical protein